MYLNEQFLIVCPYRTKHINNKSVYKSKQWNIENYLFQNYLQLRGIFTVYLIAWLPIKNPAYRRHWVSQWLRIVALIAHKNIIGGEIRRKKEQTNGTCHVSPVMCHLSPVTCYLSLINNTNSHSDRPSPCSLPGTVGWFAKTTKLSWWPVYLPLILKKNI